jgi:hypothetical protein
MEGRVVYGIFGGINLGLVAMMVWLYASSGVTMFLGMAAFGLLFVVAVAGAAIEEWNTSPQDEAEESPMATTEPILDV